MATFDNNLISPGPYIGTVMSTVDTSCMGRLWVHIPELAGGLAINNSKSWIAVRYVSPFYGVTNSKSAETVDSGNTQQSYGMWFVPPDLGIQVMVMFVMGDLSKGFWFACVPSQLMNHMIPGIAGRGAASSSDDMTPITEYDKSSLTDFNSTASAYSDIKITPKHTIQDSVLIQQGLTNDLARGPSSSTVRRESPSGVFGISTPGPVTARMDTDPIKNPLGYRTVTGRAGGHQFVMDDGDALGQSQMIKLRSSNGGTIMINDSIGSIYVINQAGSAWVELTNSGRIDVYGGNSISVHSQGDINLTADNDVNILAGGKFSVVADQISTDGGSQTHRSNSDYYVRGPNVIVEGDGVSLIGQEGAGNGIVSAGNIVTAGPNADNTKTLIFFKNPHRLVSGAYIKFDNWNPSSWNDTYIVQVEDSLTISLNSTTAVTTDPATGKVSPAPVVLSASSTIGDTIITSKIVGFNVVADNGDMQFVKIKDNKPAGGNLNISSFSGEVKVRAPFGIDLRSESNLTFHSQGRWEIYAKGGIYEDPKATPFGIGSMFAFMETMSVEMKLITVEMGTLVGGIDAVGSLLAVTSGQLAATTGLLSQTALTLSNLADVVTPSQPEISLAAGALGFEALALVPAINGIGAAIPPYLSALVSSVVAESATINAIMLAYSLICNWHAGFAKGIDQLGGSDALIITSDIVQTPTPYINPTTGDASQIKLIPQHEPWPDHEYFMGKGPVVAPAGSKPGDPILASGRGFVDPTDTVNRIKGSDA